MKFHLGEVSKVV